MNFMDQFKDVIVNNTHDVFLFLDINGRITYTNKSAKWILGYTTNELISKNLHELTISDDFNKLNNFFSNINSRKLYNTCELRLIHKQGFVVWVSATVTFIIENQKSMPVVILKEITEKKILEEKLKDCKNQLNRLHNNNLVDSQILINNCTDSTAQCIDFNSYISLTINKVKLPLNTLSQLLSDIPYEYGNYEDFKRALNTVQLEAEKMEKILTEISEFFLSQ